MSHELLRIVLMLCLTFGPFWFFQGNPGG